MNKEIIEKAIKNSPHKWDKSSYAYALGAMSREYHNYDGYKKAELIEMFYKKCETKFHCINTFTTFKHLSK